MIFTILNDSMLLLVKKPMTAEKGREFYALFRKTARQELTEILPEVPDIGDSIFLSSYWCGVCCIAWYRAFLRLGVDPDEANQWIWRVIERSLQMLPGFLIPFVRKLYLGGDAEKGRASQGKTKCRNLAGIRLGCYLYPGGQRMLPAGYPRVCNPEAVQEIPRGRTASFLVPDGLSGRPLSPRRI